MIIHTNLSLVQFADLLAEPRLKNDVYYERWDESGSRTHPRKFDVLLWGRTQTSRSGVWRKRPNPGTSTRNRYGVGGWAATFDEWGWFLAALFDADPTARCGTAKHPVYKDREDFHDRTHGVYRPIGAERNV